jgi:cytochrome c peroxidase
MLKTAHFLAAVALAATGLAARAVDRVPPPTAADMGWRLADVPMPKDNISTPERAELGKTLFFDPRLSGAGALSCTSCHEPSLGWADGRKTAIIGSNVLGRASPTMVNLGYNTQFMWDGRKKDLEEQALGPAT